ncbi:MAG: D-alanine--D-alanine ligase [Treponema sp.]|nr:D-alanine--D-alanine ligase [Treponema sp.]
MPSNNEKKRVGILCGGKSAEHEISLQSAKNVHDAIDRNLFDPVMIEIDKQGRWRLSDGRELALVPGGGRDAFRVLGDSSSLELDVVFPILHGPFGEDGTAQGLLKLAGLPFVGSGVLGSAAGMDKEIMKRLFVEAGLPVGKYFCLRAGDKILSFPAAQVRLAGARRTLCDTLFVKPANMGSSVGVSRARGNDEFRAAVKEALRYDTKVIIEENIPGREIECAVLGNENPESSLLGEIIPADGFYSYSAKYLDENGARLFAPTDEISIRGEWQIRQMAIKAFQAIGCEGLARVDFFLRRNRYPVVNEINTMPGFTKISMYPRLWEVTGVGYTELVSRLIGLAIERHERQSALRTSL